MIVFWWHGRGYLTIYIWLVTMCAFGLLLAIGKPLVPDKPWYWGLAFVAAAAVNWRKGTVLNARSLAKHKPQTIWKRLTYKSVHRFMSLPMETFSIVFIILGVVIAARGAMGA